MGVGGGFFQGDPGEPKRVFLIGLYIPIILSGIWEAGVVDAIICNDNYFP